MHLLNEDCPNCGTGVGTRILGIRCGLGPTLLVCPKKECGKLLRSKCVEWLDMTAGQKFRFLVVSVFEAFGLAFMTGLATAMSIYLLRFSAGGPPWEMKAILISAALGFAFAVTMQVLRVYWSKDRSRRGIKALRAAFSSPQCHLQTHCCSALAVIIAVSAAIGWLCGSH